MGGFFGQVSKLLGGGAIQRVVDRVLPERVSEKEKLDLERELTLEMMSQSGEAISAEAKSEDSYVSRARPTFLYIMYVVIIFNFIFIPLSAQLCAILLLLGVTDLNLSTQLQPLVLPKEMWYLFGSGYLGYAGARTWEKINGKKLLKF
jgi:hypothetical protein